MNLREEKKQLRKELMKKESELPKEYIERSDAGIAENLLSLPEFRSAQSIMFFYSIWSEPDTIRIMEQALILGKTVALPQTLPEGVMKARRVQSLGDLVPAVFNIPSPTEEMAEMAPDELDFILVPSVVYDRSGFRLGHGGGYYDRYLSRTSAFKCGIARERMLEDRVPRGKYDVAVDCLVTEASVFRFKNN